MESECQTQSIEQWYERAVKLDRNIRESRREKKQEARRIEKEWRKIKEMKVREKI